MKNGPLSPPLVQRPQSRRWPQWASGLLLFAAGCAEPRTTTQVPAAALPVPAGQARIWFYRPLEPYGSLNLARIDMNDSYVGAVENGNAFYRDVPPGRYHIAPESFGRDFNQDKDVDLGSGQQLYVKIVSLESWGVSVSGSKNFERDTFYAWLIPQEVAQVEIARNRSGIWQFPFKACGIASSRVLAHDRSIVPMCSPGREVLFPSTAGRSAIASSLRTA